MKKTEIMNGETVYKLRIPGGEFEINVCYDDLYPGIDIEFIPDNEPENHSTRPRILIEKAFDGEKNDFGKLRTAIWGNPESEDYSENIIFENT